MIDILCATLLLLHMHLRMGQEPGGPRGVEIVMLVLWAESFYAASLNPAVFH